MPAPASPDAPSPVAAAKPVVVDDTPPTPLETWRAVAAAGEAAAATESLPDRIAACRAFLETHPDHQQAHKVTEALVEGLVESGTFDKAELAQLVERLAEHDEDNASEPLSLVRKYHVEHDLPTPSALKLVELSRRRIATQWDELEFETNERAKEWMALRLRYQEADSHVAEARVHLAQSNATEALEALSSAETAAEDFAHDVAIVDAEGKTVRVLASGMMDQMHVLAAAAHQGRGQTDAARKEMDRTLGFVSDIDVRELYEDTREKLGIATAPRFAVKGEALPAQNFELERLGGKKKVKLSDRKGKVVLVTFWATWCGPCKRELPELQKFQARHAKDGVEVLAINIDDYSQRSKIEPFLEKNNLELEVLLEDPKQLSSYNYGAIPALYVIDREGRVAHARTGYDPQLKEKLAGEIADIVAGKPSTGRDLVSVETAPAGYALRWQTPVSTNADVVAVGEAGSGLAGQIGTVGRNGLSRWSATGQPLGTKPLAGWTRSLHAADLDADGKREWIVGGWQALRVLDEAGDTYWEHDGRFEVAGVRDLNGDGFADIVLKEEDRVTVMKSVPDPLWRSNRFKDIESVVLDEAGGVLVQADGAVTALDARGTARGAASPSPEGRLLAGRLGRGASAVDLFRGKWDQSPILGHDVDGDGRSDIVVPGSHGVVAYDQEGNTILRLRSRDVDLATAVGDVDGKPGDEIVLFVEHYGLVVLGPSKDEE